MVKQDCNFEKKNSMLQTEKVVYLKTSLTFKLPQQEQGDSMIVSSSSSWHILHSTNFLADDSVFMSILWEQSIVLWLAISVNSTSKGRISD